MKGERTVSDSLQDALGTKSVREQLEQVNTAISNILVGGQSYKIGSRSLTRADLSLLRTMQQDLTARLAAEDCGNLVPDTYVAVFEGR
jgi:hypothetical protein